MTALHLAYRPQTLEQLVGQPYVQQALSNAIRHQQIAPAYLFAGTKGTGKTSTARILAKSLNCLASDRPTLTPCGQCNACISIERSTSLDVMEIDAASNNSVNDARNLLEHIGLAPIQSRYRIFLIDEVHCLTDNAFNALLKSIEEPPDRVVFVLCTTELDKVLPTIVSRCQRFDFRALSHQTIVAQLRWVSESEDIVIHEEALNAIARLSQGGMRDALQLLAQAQLLGEAVTADHIFEMVGGIPEASLLIILEAIASQNVLATLQQARQLIDDGRSPKSLLNSLIQVYRDLLIVQSTPQAQFLLSGAVRYASLSPIAQQWSSAAIHRALDLLQKAERQLRQSTNAQVWTEVCLLNLIPTEADQSIEPQHSPTVEYPTGIQKNGTQTGNGSHHKQQRTELIEVGNGNSKRSSTAIATLTPTALWEDIIAQSSTTNQKLLRQATLAKVNRTQAILQVPSHKQPAFEKYHSQIEKLIQKISNYPALKLNLEVI